MDRIPFTPSLAILRLFLVTALAACMMAAFPALPDGEAFAAQPITRGPSGLPLPRFVSLKSGRVNMRVGPGLNYQVNWLYLREGLPMEIMQEYDNWRRVRDADGAEGWINQALLSGRRTAMAAPWFKGKETKIMLRGSPDKGARAVAEIEPGAIGAINSCNDQWCEMRFGSYTGWIDQGLIWGAYPGEKIGD